MWKLRRKPPLNAAEERIMTIVTRCVLRLVELEKQLQEHKERMDTRLAAIEKRLDKLEGIY